MGAAGGVGGDAAGAAAASRAHAEAAGEEGLAAALPPGVAAREAPQSPDGVRQQIKGLLGFDIDLRFIKTQCRVSQGNLDREVMSQIGFLKSELVRCSDTI